MDYENLLIEKENGYVVAIINHPPANAISQGVLGDLDALIDKCLSDDEVHAIVIAGSGEKLFSAGADITEFAGLRTGGDRDISGSGLLLKIESSPKPIIAAMQGSAYGGGLELAMSCHLRVMSASAKAGQPEVKLGIMPCWGGTQRLPRLIGKSKALEMTITGDPIIAEEALQYGLVNRVVPGGQVLSESKALAAKLAKGAPLAIGEIIKAMNQGLEVTLEEGLQIEQDGFSNCFTSEDAVEGSTAFLEKRPANFRGR